VSEIAGDPPPIPPGRTRCRAGRSPPTSAHASSTATLAARKGFLASTVADIARTARVDKRVFYTHFRDKRHAFEAVYELCFREALAALWHPTGRPELHVQIRDCLRAAKITANVAGGD
jgi:AcrR family transcriptional regulator